MIGLGVVMILDLALIPDHGLAGAAWASVVAYSAMGAVAAVLLRRHVTSRPPPPIGTPRSAG
jgi:Na+-driven multidrug efflux pump